MKAEPRGDDSTRLVVNNSLRQESTLAELAMASRLLARVPSWLSLDGNLTARGADAILHPMLFCQIIAGDSLVSILDRNEIDFVLRLVTLIFVSDSGTELGGDQQDCRQRGQSPERAAPHVATQAFRSLP